MENQTDGASPTPPAPTSGLMPAAVLDWRIKALPVQAEGSAADRLSMLGMSLLHGDFLTPVAVLRQSAMEHNRSWMRHFLAATGTSLAPHGKTTMSPEIFAMQIADGAWGMTAATAHHVRVYRRLGIARILHANQLVAPADIEYVLGELHADPSFEYFGLADSVAVVERLDRAAARQGADRPLNLLVEVGGVGGRTGVRSVDEGLTVARAIAGSSHLALRGVETFEGIFQSSADGTKRMEAMLDDLLELADRCNAEGLFGPGEVILTAGGSGFFDRCATRLRESRLAGRSRAVLRSGCYITHDSQLYEQLAQAMFERTPALGDLGRGLQSALEVWTCIQSTPEPGRAIAALGKRDVGTDAGMPIPHWWFRPGVHDAPLPMEGVQIGAIYDQHACIDGTWPFEIGDMVGFGVSHPCTTFDKWRALFVVDDAYRVISAVTTCF
jgi:D-serine dehydratase